MNRKAKQQVIHILLRYQVISHLGTDKENKQLKACQIDKSGFVTLIM